MTPFTGLAAFSLTPMDASGAVDADLLCRMLDRIIAAGCDAIGLLGSTGSYASLSPDERKQTLDIAAAHVSGRLPLIVGIGAYRTEAAIDLARHAAQAGASGLLLPPLSYQPLTEAEALRLVADVAGATDLPICLYNTPRTTQFTFTPALIGQLAHLPTVAAAKMPFPADGDVRAEMAQIRDVTRETFSIGHSGDWTAKDALGAGSACWYSVIAGLLPAPARALTDAVRSGDAAEATRLNSAFMPLWSLFQTFGSYRVMYALANLMDLGPVAPPRPVLPIPEATVDAVLHAITAIDRATGT